VIGSTGWIADTSCEPHKGSALRQDRLRSLIFFAGGIDVDGASWSTSTLKPNNSGSVAGDVASFYDPISRSRRRSEHWDNAVKQGRIQTGADSQSRRVIHNRRNGPSTVACVPYTGPTLGDASDRFERERDALAPSITHVNSNYGDALSLKPAIIWPRRLALSTTSTSGSDFRQSQQSGGNVSASTRALRSTL
jgi:hypothetical protein